MNYTSLNLEENQTLSNCSARFQLTGPEERDLSLFFYFLTCLVFCNLLAWLLRFQRTTMDENIINANIIINSYIAELANATATIWVSTKYRPARGVSNFDAHE